MQYQMVNIGCLPKIENNIFEVHHFFYLITKGNLS